LARFGRPDAAVVTRPSTSFSSAAFTDDVDPPTRSTFSSVATESRPTIVDSLTDSSVVLIPESGYDDFISEKKLSSNRPHVIAVYNPRIDPTNGFKDPTFQLSEVQYLLDSDTVSAAVQVISSSIPAQQLAELTVDNIALAVEAKRAIDALRSVYLGKRQFSRNLSGFDSSAISARSSRFINSISSDIGIGGWTAKISRAPFFNERTIDSFLGVYPTDLSKFSSKTMASKILNLALMSTDLAFFSRDVVKTFKEDPSLGERLGSALYTRGISFPEEISENPDYISSPDDLSLEDAIRGLGRALAGGVLKSEANPATTYVADADRSLPSSFEPVLDSLFFTDANLKRVETFANSSFAATSPDGYVTFEDSVLLKCFTKQQKDSPGFLEASSLASQASQIVLRKAESLVVSCRPFSSNLLDPQKRLMKFLVALLRELGSILDILKEIDTAAEIQDVESVGSPGFSNRSGVPRNALRDLAVIAQSCTQYGTSVFEVSFIEGVQASYTTNVQIGTIPDPGAAFLYRHTRIDDSEGQDWLEARLYDSENTEIHPIFAMIDAQITSVLGFTQEIQVRAARSVAVQFLSRSLRSVFFDFETNEAGGTYFTFSRTDLAAIPFAIDSILSGGLGFPSRPGLSSEEIARINNIRISIIDDALSPIRAITDQVVASLEFVDMVESYASSLASCDNLSRNLRSASSTLSSVTRIKGITTPLALTRDSLIASSLYFFTRSATSGITGYSTQEVLSENEYKTILSRLLKISQESTSEDDLSYFVVGFPFGLLERCRNESPSDTDLFLVNFKFEIDGIESTVTKTFSPNIRKTELSPGQAADPIEQIDTDKVKTLSYIDGVQDIVRTRSGEAFFSIQDTSYLEAFRIALTSGCLIDFMWNLLGIDLSETAVRDSATYAPSSRITDIKNDQSRFFARRIQDLSIPSQARLGSAFQRTTLFGQSRAVDDIFGFKYMDCVYAFPVRSSEIPGVSSGQFVGKVFVSVEPSIFGSVRTLRGNF